VLNGSCFRSPLGQREKTGGPGEAHDNYGDGVTLFEGFDARLVPAALVAFTLKV
jgi:hypothetical protein